MDNVYGIAKDAATHIVDDMEKHPIRDRTDQINMMLFVIMHALNRRDAEWYAEKGKFFSLN